MSVYLCVLLLSDEQLGANSIYVNITKNPADGVQLRSLNFVFFVRCLSSKLTPLPHPSPPGGQKNTRKQGEKKINK